MIIPFGSWEPDLPALGNTGATTAKNVIPHGKSYKKFPALTAFSSALTAYCRGAYAAIDGDGAVSSYSGDASKLYRLVGMTFTDSSKVGGYNTVSDSYWEFQQFGQSVIATNYDDTIQTIDIGDPQFADLTGTPPRARHVAAVRDFLVVGNTFDASDGAIPNRIRWPGIGTTTSWTVSAATQADYQDLQGNGGWVQSIIGGVDVGYVFQERAIWRMNYVGSPIIFDIAKIEDARGALAPRGVIQVGPMVFFLADDGFYMLAGGQTIPIGSLKVDRTFLSELDDSYLHRVTSAAFPDLKVVLWSYPGSGSVDGTPSRIIMYNWVAQNWAIAEFNHELMYRAMTVGTTLEDLDSISGSIDTLPYSLDSKVWMGGKLQISAFDTNHKQGYFTGTALDATLETGEVQLNPLGRAEITEVVPLVDGGTHTAQMGTRETQAVTVTWGSASTENSSGICPVRSNSRYHRVRVNNTGDFTDAIGVNIPDDKIIPVGGR